VILAFLAYAGASALAASPGLGDKAATILEQRCFACHSDKTAMSDLKLTSREQILRGGNRGPAVRPGQPDESLLFQAVTRSGKLTMPPGPKLPDDEIETLRAWIAGGIEWPKVVVARGADWWAFHKPSRPPVPEIEGAKSAIDAFILARLKTSGLEPAAEADRLTLLRRACFDLHGLPPTPEQTQEFLADNAPGAWERLIDRLLASPRYGEKWGRHWLDLVRYGDTAGFEQDPYILEAWR